MDLKELVNGKKNKLDINSFYTIDPMLYQNTDIIALDQVKVEGSITYVNSIELLLDVEVNGTMTLEDSVNLNPIKYPFSFKICENVFVFIVDRTMCLVTDHKVKMAARK